MQIYTNKTTNKQFFAFLLLLTLPITFILPSQASRPAIMCLHPQKILKACKISVLINCTYDLFQQMICHKNTEHVLFFCSRLMSLLSTCPWFGNRGRDASRYICKAHICLWVLTESSPTCCPSEQPPSVMEKTQANCIFTALSKRAKSPPLKSKLPLKKRLTGPSEWGIKGKKNYSNPISWSTGPYKTFSR